MRAPWWFTDAFPGDVPTLYPPAQAARVYLARLTLLLVVMGTALAVGVVGWLAIVFFA